MMLAVVFIAALFGGLVLSFGPHVLSTILSSVGSFERLSWFSLIGCAFIAIYWLVFGIRMYRRANSETSNVRNYGKRQFRIGIVITVLWIMLFIVTDYSANAAVSFSTWRLSNADGLDIAAKIGHLLLAFAGGIFVARFRRTSRSSRNPTNGSTGDEPDSSM